MAGSYATVHRMCLDFREQTKSIFEPQNGAPLNLAIAYENFSAGVRASALFHRLFDAAGHRYQFDMNNAWRFDFLKMAKFRKTAIAATARADMLIVSVSTWAELPPAVKWWLEASLEQREGDPGALIVLQNGRATIEGEKCTAKFTWRSARKNRFGFLS